MIELNSKSYPLALGLVVVLLVGLALGGFATFRIYSDKHDDLVSELRSSTARRFLEQSSNGTFSDQPRPIIVADAKGLSDAFSSTSASVKTGVVYIQVSIGTEEDGIEGWSSELSSRLFRDHLAKQSVGSGVLLTDDGYVVTNNHVVENAQLIFVTLADKRRFEAEVVGVDATTDIAVLKINQSELPFVAVGDSDALEVGEWVLAVGNPFRLTSTVTAGIVSAVGRDVNIIDNVVGIEDFIQTDAAINPGNSGGALVNLDGELIGINTAIATESGSNEGYGFAVPVNLVKRVVADLIEYGEVRRGFLGVSIGEVDSKIATEKGLDQISGVYVAEVCDDCSADKAGLRAGDIVLSVNDRPVNASNELQSVVARQRPGDELKLKVWRGAKSVDIVVVLRGTTDPATDEWLADMEPDELERQPRRELPKPGSGVVDVEEWGLGVRPLTDNELVEFGVENGIFIEYVEHGKAFDLAGIPRSSVITAVGDSKISSVADLVSALSVPDKDAQLVRIVKRDGISYFYELESTAVR